ncbi:MAG: hypothetical protein IJG37_01005 [Synergistaceae bacterium]|nr:hypothetical protein [Synergistaceae bacterium]
MTKCKTLDRLALTRQRFPHMYGDDPQSVGEQIIDGLKEAIEAERMNKRREGYSTCPNCGQETLIHEDGCKHCRSCGWSACG